MGQTLGKLQDSSSHKRIEGHRRGSAQMTGKLQTIATRPSDQYRQTRLSPLIPELSASRK
jgi:hypothetical protein